MYTNVDLFGGICVLFPRDGVSESQFSQVLNIEIDQIIKVIIVYYLVYLLSE